MSRDKNKVVVIGGGPAGIEAARAASVAGAHVTVVSESPIGGRAGWHSLLPSKVWLAAANRLASNGTGPRTAASSESADFDAVHVLQEIEATANAWNGALRAKLAEQDVEIIQGSATFAGPTRVRVSSGESRESVGIDADRIIIATGSVPVFPEPMKPDGSRVFAPRFARHWQSLPSSMVVVGASVTGSEFAFLFNSLGVDVTWIVDQFGILPTFRAALGRSLRNIFTDRGIKIIEGYQATSIRPAETGVHVQLDSGERFHAEAAFVAIGRRPDVGRLKLEVAGLNSSDGLETDAFGRTEIPSIYVVGDASGEPMTANRAMAQGWIAGRHAAGVPVNPYNPHSSIAAVYTAPEVAQVGTFSGTVEIARVEVGASLKAHIQRETAGFVELAFNPDTGRIRGAAALAPHAEELLLPIAVAIHLEATIDSLVTLFPAHPSFGELPFTAVRQA